MEWSVEVYTDATGNAPVRDFLRRLPAKDSAKVAWVIRLLAEYGIELHMPHARHLAGKLWELRARVARDTHRVVYFLHVEHRFILLHGFTKKTVKTPRREIEIARRNMADFLEQEAAQPIEAER